MVEDLSGFWGDFAEATTAVMGVTLANPYAVILAVILALLFVAWRALRWAEPRRGGVYGREGDWGGR